MNVKPRFVLMEHPPKEWPTSCLEGTKCWQDTWRPLDDGVESRDAQGNLLRYVAVQTYPGKDANNYVTIAPEMCLLFTDQAEFYVVCPDCRMVYGHMQWSGSTGGGRDWREHAEAERQKHQRTKGWCEFCDPVFGNGGWRL